MKKHFILFLKVLIPACIYSQHPYYTTTIAFYNLENLFDCENDPLTFDDDFTPTGLKKWTTDRYQRKITKISETLSELKGHSHTSAAIIGLCELENRRVLEDLLKAPALSKTDYGIAHHNSPDKRGIDVALLYDRKVFQKTNSQSHTLYLQDQKQNRIYTRSQLCVTGYLDGEHLGVIVNHWPSRRGGKQKSDPFRIKAAKRTQKIIDSLYQTHTDALKIIVMGDLNDNPTDKSLKKILQTRGSRKAQKHSPFLYNPTEGLFQKGLGSLAFRDHWYLFDQMLFSHHFISPKTEGFQLYQTHIYRPKKVQIQEGNYKGYPKSTYKRGQYIGGYSDHFPIYSTLIKKANKF